MLSAIVISETLPVNEADNIVVQTTIENDRNAFMAEEGMAGLSPEVPPASSLRNIKSYRTYSIYKRQTTSINRHSVVALSTTDLTTDDHAAEYSLTADKKAMHRPCDYYVYGLRKLIC